MKSPRKTGNSRHQKSPRRGSTTSRMMQQHGHGVVPSSSQSRSHDSARHSRRHDSPSHPRRHASPSHQRRHDSPSHTRRHDPPSHTRGDDSSSPSRRRSPIHTRGHHSPSLNRRHRSPSPSRRRHSPAGPPSWRPYPSPSHKNHSPSPSRSSHSPNHSRRRHSYTPYFDSETRMPPSSQNPFQGHTNFQKDSKKRRQDELRRSFEPYSRDGDRKKGRPFAQTKSKDFFCNRRARDYQARENCWSKYTSGGIGFKTLTFPKDASSKQVERIIMDNYPLLAKAGGFALCGRKNSRSPKLVVKSTIPPTLNELDKMFPRTHVIYLVPLQDDLPLDHSHSSKVECKRCYKLVLPYKLGKHLSIHDRGYDEFSSDMDSEESTDDDRSPPSANKATDYEQSFSRSPKDSGRWTPSLMSSPLLMDSRRAGGRQIDDLPVPHELNQPPRSETGFGLLEPQPGPSSAAVGQGFSTMNRRSSGSRQQSTRSPDGNRVPQVRYDEHRWPHRFESDSSRCGTGFNSRSERHHPGRKQSQRQSSSPEYEPQPGPSKGNPSFQRASSSSGARGICPVNTKSRPSVTECEPQPGPSQGNPGFQRSSSSSGPGGPLPLNTKAGPFRPKCLESLLHYSDSESTSEHSNKQHSSSTENKRCGSPERRLEDISSSSSRDIFSENTQPLHSEESIDSHVHE